MFVLGNKQFATISETGGRAVPKAPSHQVFADLFASKFFSNPL